MARTIAPIQPTRLLLIVIVRQLILDYPDRRYPESGSFWGKANAALSDMLYRPADDMLVYVWGGAGSGKKHLLKAWVQKELHEGRQAFYVPAGEKLTDEMTLTADALAAEDVGMLDGGSQQLLFELFNRFRNSGRGSLLLGAQTPPAVLPVREDLRTRAAFCHVYEIKPLDDEEKVEALACLARLRQIPADEEVFRYLLNHYRRDFDSLVHMLDTADRYALSQNRRITLPLLRQLLEEENKDESGCI